jgi:purine-binding chemotaxis protein CheW
VVFRLGDNWFGVDIAQIERVVPSDYLARLSLAPGTLLGSVGIGNRLVSVVDLKALLGLGRSSLQSSSTILVVRTGDSEIGILADEFVDVFFVPTSLIRECPETEDPLIRQVVRGECVCGDRTINLLDVSGTVQSLPHVTLAAAG